MLYFINPSRHGLKTLDIEMLLRVHHKVNVVPVIAKADTLTKQELHRLKVREKERDSLVCGCEREREREREREGESERQRQTLLLLCVC